MRFDGKVAVVTGAGRGIGAAYARALAGDGANVVVAELDADAGTAVAGECAALGVESVCVPTDVGDPDSVAAMAASVALSAAATSSFHAVWASSTPPALARRESFTAASIASAPELQKNTFPPSEDSVRRSASR